MNGIFSVIMCLTIKTQQTDYRCGAHTTDFSRYGSSGFESRSEDRLFYVFRDFPQAFRHATKEGA